MKTKYRGNGSPFVGMVPGLRDMLRKGTNIIADTQATKDAKKLAQPVQRPDRSMGAPEHRKPVPQREV